MSPELERGPARALYMQIADHYRSQIVRGDLAEGERLPTVQQMTQDWGVSQRTIQKAISALRAQYLVETSRQQGTRVAAMRAAQGGRDVIAEPTGSAERDVVEVISARVVQAPDTVADLLDIAPSSDGKRYASRREAVTRRDGTPVRLSVSWAPPWAYEVTPELLEPRLVNGLKAVQRSTGRTPSHGKDFLEGRGATEDEAHRLEVAAGSPVLVGASLWWDARGPVEYRQWTSPPGMVISHEYPVHLG